ncbi:hypothetical protein LTR53_015842, partial [Teratosphaeriaceae sp. CCFEE 6253]
HNPGGNLEEAIRSAKQRIDWSTEEVLTPDTLDSASSLTPATTGTRGGIGPPHATSLASPSGAARPPSRKGFRQPGTRPRPSPLMQAPAGAEDESRPFDHQPSSASPSSPHDRSLHRSPHAVESNPGLVSDHEDDDHGSASEDEVPQAAIAHSLGVLAARRDCAEGMEIDVSVEEEDDDAHGVIIRSSGLRGADDRGLGTDGSASGKLGGRNTEA